MHENRGALASGSADGEPAPRKFNERTLLIAPLLPVLGYLYRYLYESGYADHFGIPADFISVSLDSLLSPGTVTALAVLGVAIMCAFLFPASLAEQRTMQRIERFAPFVTVVVVFSVAAIPFRPFTWIPVVAPQSLLNVVLFFVGSGIVVAMLAAVRLAVRLQNIAEPPREPRWILILAAVVECFPLALTIVVGELEALILDVLHVPWIFWIPIGLLLVVTTAWLALQFSPLYRRVIDRGLGAFSTEPGGRTRARVLFVRRALHLYEEQRARDTFLPRSAKLRDTAVIGLAVGLALAVGLFLMSGLPATPVLRTPSSAFGAATVIAVAVISVSLVAFGWSRALGFGNPLNLDVLLHAVMKQVGPWTYGAVLIAVGFMGVFPLVGWYTAASEREFMFIDSDRYVVLRRYGENLVAARYDNGTLRQDFRLISLANGATIDIVRRHIGAPVVSKEPRPEPPPVLVAQRVRRPSPGQAAGAVAWGAEPHVELRAFSAADEAVNVEPTKARLAYDDDTMYLAFDITESRRSHASANGNARFDQGNRMEVYLWPDGPSGQCYEFVVNAAGAHAQRFCDRTPFRATWNSRAAPRKGGYVASGAIPFAAVPSDGSATWRIRFCRYHVAGSHVTASVWPPLGTSDRPDDGETAATIEGMAPRRRNSTTVR